MRCLLLSADMSHADANMSSVYAHARFIVVTNVHRREFRSSLSVEEGLEPKWEQEPFRQRRQNRLWIYFIARRARWAVRKAIGLKKGS